MKSKDSKILLIEPSMKGKYPGIHKDFDKGFDIPYGLLAIASHLKNKNIKSKIIHMDYETRYYGKTEEEILIDELTTNDPKIVGFTSFTLQYNEVKKLAGIVRNFNSKIKIAIGGHHAMHSPKEVLETKLFDTVIIGEGENTFEEYIGNISSKKSMENIRGIAYLNSKKKIIINPERNRLEGKEISTPDYSFLPKKLIENANIHIMTSRGCPYVCNFCSRAESYGRGVKIRSLDSVKSEIEVLVRKYGHKEIAITDETLHARPNFKEFMGTLKESHDKLGVFYSSMSRADLILKYPDSLKLMKKAGIDSFCIGAESGSQKVLDSMNKGITVDMIPKALKLIKNSRINTGTFWMIGHPGSSFKEEMKTKKMIENLLVENLSDFIEVDIFIPFPGSVSSKDPRISWKEKDFSKFNRTANSAFSLNNFSAKEIKKAYLGIIETLYKYGKKNANQNKENYQ